MLESDLSKRVATRPLTPEEVAMRDEASARMPEIMREFRGHHQRMIENMLKRQHDGRAPHIRLTSSLRPSQHLPMVLGR